MRKTIIITVFIILMCFSGCASESKFAISDFDIEEYDMQNYESCYVGQGNVEALDEGNYFISLDYNKTGGITDDKSGSIFISVVDGEGSFTTDDSSKNDELTEPEYKFKVEGYIPFVDAKDMDFELSGFNLTPTETEYFITYNGAGKVATDSIDPYIIILKYAKKGGNEKHPEGHMYILITDHEGEFTTEDKLRLDEPYAEPDYEFEVAGYLSFEKYQGNKFSVSEFDLDKELIGYIGKGTIDSNDKKSYIVLLKYDKEDGEPGAETGYQYVFIGGGKGEFSTFDKSPESEDEQFKKPDYEFEVVGYIEFQK